MLRRAERNCCARRLSRLVARRLRKQRNLQRQPRLRPFRRFDELRGGDLQWSDADPREVLQWSRRLLCGFTDELCALPMQRISMPNELHGAG